jgi:hypothetical protein
MGFRSGKRIKIAQGLSLNMGSRGFSLRAGVKGAGYTVGTSGHRVSGGLPGTGVSFSHKLGRSRPRAANQPEPAYGPVARFFRVTLGLLLCLALGGISLGMLFGGK